MTKEELEKEAENWLRKYLLCCNCEKKCNCIDSNSYCEEQVLKAYVDSAELREKQIEIDAEQIRALQKQNGELTDEVKELEEELKQAEKVKVVEHFEAYGQCRDSRRITELEAQIEKMKCCEICSHNRGGCSYHHNWTKGCLENNHKYFELRR